MIRVNTLLICCTVITGLIYKSAYASTPEDIFQDAIKYTVEIRTIIDMPFSDEEEGVFKGTGFVVDAEKGWILTNAHVAGYSPSHVDVAFKDTEFFEAEKLYVDPKLDVAVIRADTSNFPNNVISAPLDCSETPGVGHPVGAFGHPWSLAYTGTRGIISGTTFFDGNAWLQTDAPINGGNSGGPLISMQTGRLVGMNAAKVVDEEIESLNFAVPMNYACKILALLHDGKDPSPPLLPLRFLDYDDNHKELVVAKAIQDENVATLETGDIIIGVGNTEDVIFHESQLIHALRGIQGHTNLSIQRNGKELQVSINVQPSEMLTKRNGVYVSGLIIAPSTYKDESEINLGNALMVHYVEGGTAAQSQGIQPWDFIKTVDGVEIKNIENIFEHFSKAYENQRNVEIIIKRIYDTGHQLFSYKKVSLPVADLQIIGSDYNEISKLARK